MGITLTELKKAFERSMACRDCKIPLFLVDEQEAGRCERCWSKQKALREILEECIRVRNKEGRLIVTTKASDLCLRSSYK